MNCEVGIKIDGRELPNMAVVGEALEAAIEVIMKHVTDSYKEVPERDGATPMAELSVADKLAQQRQREMDEALDEQPAQDKPTPSVPNFG